MAPALSDITTPPPSGLDPAGSPKSSAGDPSRRPAGDSVATFDGITQTAAALHCHTISCRSSSTHSTTPLIMLHGWGQSEASLRPLAEKLAWRRAIHLVDLPGFGQSPWSGEDWNTRDYALCLLQYLDNQGIERADLLGHSFGGRVSLRIAAEWPDRVGQLLLVASAGLPRRLTTRQKLRKSYVRGLGKLCHLLPGNSMRKWHQDRFGSVDYKNAGDLRATLIKTVTEDQTESVKRIAAPTLLLWGELDDATPVDIARRLEQLIQGAQLEILPGCDHFPYLGNGIHPCAQIINEFIEDNDKHASSHEQTNDRGVEGASP